MNRLVTYIGLLISSLLLFGACIDDQGNYDYTNPESLLPVQIEGLPTDITILKGETLQLSPTIINDNPSRYTYSWYIMDYEAAGSLPRQWDLSEEKDLVWTANLDAARYRLNFRIYDRELELYTRHEITVSISAAPMTTGWYILKDNGSETDIDYIGLKAERYNDILAGYGSTIPGRAVMMAYQPSRYYHTITNEDGTVTTKSNLSVYYFLTSEDIRTYDAKDFTLYKKYEDQFYALPETCRPQHILFQSSGSNTYIINNGKLHKIYGMSPNIGKFSAPYTGFYELTDCLVPYTRSNRMVFDQSTRSFFQISVNGTNLTPIEKAANENDTISLQNTNYEILCTGANETENIGTVILKSTTEDSYYLLQESSVYDPATWTYQIVWNTVASIDETSHLRKANLIAQSKATFFYFSLKDKVYSYVHSEGTPLENRERERLSFPGEEITYMAYISNLELADEINTEALAVLTSQDGNWKLRVYSLPGESTPDLNTTPILEYEGTGLARYLLYRAS